MKNDLGNIPSMIATTLSLIHIELKHIRETLEKIEKQREEITNKKPE